MEIYDKAKWHEEHPDYPSEVGPAGAHLYGGFMLHWLAKKGLLGEETAEDFAQEIDALLQRRASPATTYRLLGGVLASDMLSEEGQDFAHYCFESDEFDYYGLFEEALAGALPSPYHVIDDFASSDRLGVALDKVYASWRRLRSS